MPATVSVLYPNEADAKYNIDYYVESHMPMAAATWKSAGVKSWKVTKYSASPDGKQPKYAFAGILTFDSVESIHKALASPDTAKVMQDVPNYSNKEPVFLIGEDAKEATL
ncbi:hypothetical protein CPAR01_13708 [Colletotrichum paranaense]|uniref:Ethyl tert-butyl ether degradation EthD n=9 Tax=Colletotrichum acutatum species complex TaxID=2707335 RepID=A0A9P7U693_9PEZI|nr:uncharacterized protein HER10_EVM0009647 [Colletotrichum scovillei]XP_049138668.1 uncharacterized protein CLUP02_02493 [Colletotrichum lupini]XP_060343428.1 uncharacterized protein CPAR01_13708 [Colletotrichum paranaense]XP_060378924.1 uncharacterized protein CTAM01_10492 [Colletotrichum tamarilloi]XP_060394873.1 uncharacterized protein CABS01_13471 [Colletotrichum abscissum]KAI3549842.1 hypothetical protein CSPX01_02017 [Colletotrichum filicis]KAK0380251.1 hypothetical protein CLIM01_0239